MRKLAIKLLLRILARPTYNRLKPDEVRTLLTDLANDPNYERFPDYLDQLSDSYKNQFLYNQTAELKGMITAFTILRETIKEQKDAKKNQKAVEMKKKVPKGRVIKY